MAFVAESLPIQVEVMLNPGAKISLHFPKLEKDARLSLGVDAPTTIALEETGE